MADNYRGTGRTYRAVEALPDGSVFVVAHAADVRQVSSMLVKQGREPGVLKVVPLAALRTLLGLPCAVAIDADHYTYDVASHEQFDFLKRLLDRHAALNREKTNA